MARLPKTPGQGAGAHRNTAGWADVQAGRRTAAPVPGHAAESTVSALRRRNAELKALSTVQHAVSASLELKTSIEQGLLAVLTALACKSASLLLLDWETQEIEVYAARQSESGPEFAFRRLDLLALTTAGTKPPALALHQVCEAPLLAPSGEVLVSGPVVARGRSLGLLTVSLPRSRWQRHHSHRLVAEIGSAFGPAIENARLYLRMLQEADRLAAINAVGSAIRRSLRVPNLLDEALQQLLAVTNIECGAVLLYAENEKTLSVAAASGISRPLATALGNRHPGPAAGWPWPANDRPIIEEDLARESGANPSPRCLMHVPLRVEGRFLGVLMVGSFSEPHFAPGAIDLLLMVAGHISLALENARLYAELTEANEALREALRGKDEFLAHVTHELKRPLAPARIVLETLLEVPPGELSPERQEEMVAIALTNIDNLDALVSELLDAVRFQHRAQASSQGVFDLRDIARRSLAAMRPLADARRIQVQSIIPSVAVNVRGDAEGIERVIANLLSNACKFNRDQGSILLQLERTAQGEAVLSITDTGIGIPAHARPRIFERFYQADTSSTRSHEGLGLGLSIAKEIVEQHGGRIRFDTEEGVGTTFTVILPLA